MSCCEKVAEFYNSSSIRGIRLAFFVAVNTLNLVSNWLLYYSVVVTKEGLVFGYPGNVVKYALLTFSILNTITFFPEIKYDLWELLHKEEHDKFRTGNIWLVEVPQMVINLVIVSCRVEAISYFLLVKAIVIAVAVFTRIILFLVKCCINRCINHHCENCWSRFLRLVGLFVLLAGSIAIFIVTKTQRNADGRFNVKVPHNLLQGEYDDRRYFTNVSIYFSHPYLDYETSPSRDNLNLIRLLTINDLQNSHSQTDRTINIIYDSTHENFLIIKDGRFEQCFTKVDGKVTNQAVCTEKFVTPAGEFAFTFHYVLPSYPSLPFGDITYNMNVGNNTNCQAPDFQVVNNMDAYIDDPSSAMMRYFRTMPNIKEEYHIRQMSGDAYEFYRESDLINIEDVWNTYGICKSTGSSAPHMDDKLGVLCEQQE